MLEFNRSSWHYKFAKRGAARWNDPSTNLCPYVRQVVFGMIQAMLLYIALAILTGSVLLAYGTIAVYGIDTLGAGLIAGGLISAIMVLGFCLPLAVAMMAIIFSLVVGIEKLKELYRVRRWKKRDQKLTDDATFVSPPPGLLISWLRAKHEKLCPQINFK